MARKKAEVKEQPVEMTEPVMETVEAPDFGYKLRIKSIERLRMVETGDEMLEVTVQIYLPKNETREKAQLVEVLKKGYALGTTEEGIREDLKKTLALLIDEAKARFENRAAIEANKSETEMITKLTGEVL